MSHPRIIHLTSIHPAFDTRIFYKECVSLVHAGYEVTLVAPHEHSETIKGVRIHAVPRAKTRSQRITRTIWQVYRAALEEDGDLHHFHDPELILVGLLLKLHGKKVVYDMHENVPAQILGKEYLRPRWLRHLLARSTALIERIILHAFDGLVIANPLVAKRFQNPHSVTIANYPILSLIEEVAPAADILPDKPVLIYVGGLRAVRGICEIIQATTMLDRPVELWLAGPWISEAFKKHCQALPGWKNVRYLGYLTPEKVYSYLKRADIGMVTLHPQENYLTNLPVKAFEYMACSLPMIMSNISYWQKTFHMAATFVTPQEPESIAHAISRLLNHPSKARMLGKAGKNMVTKYYSWEQETQRLFSLYDQILYQDNKNDDVPQTNSQPVQN